MRATPMPEIAAPVPALRAALLDWYDRARRTLPWRAAPGAVADPWPVLVSELMLQQTTVATVRARFGPFLARFPSLASLAAAPLDEVLHAWQGLGYYRRARALHACAQAVVERHGGELPLDAAALARMTALALPVAAARPRLRRVAEGLAATDRAGDFAQAVIGEWGMLEIATNPVANFQAGIIGMRAMQSVDVGVRQAGAFSLATSIT